MQRADISKLASLGWSAETSLSRGLELTVEWIAREDSRALTHSFRIRLGEVWTLST